MKQFFKLYPGFKEGITEVRILMLPNIYSCSKRWVCTILCHYTAEASNVYSDGKQAMGFLIKIFILLIKKCLFKSNRQL